MLGGEKERVNDARLVGMPSPPPLVILLIMIMELCVCLCLYLCCATHHIVCITILKYDVQCTIYLIVCLL